MRLDALDSAIVRVLLEDARRSLREVARRVDSTPTTVAARIARLEDAGVVQGASLRLSAASLPGHARLVQGDVASEAVEDVLATAARLEGVTEALVADDGTLWVTAQVADLESEGRLVRALADAGARGLSVRAVQRRAGPPPVHLFSGSADVQEACAECGKAVVADAVVERVDDRRVVFCCRSCRRLYMERYGRFSAAASSG